MIVLGNKKKWFSFVQTSVLIWLYWEDVYRIQTFNIFCSVRHYQAFGMTVNISSKLTKSCIAMFLY